MKFNPMIRTLQKTVADGAIGEVRWIQAGVRVRGAATTRPAGSGTPSRAAAPCWTSASTRSRWPSCSWACPTRISAEGTINPDGVDKRVLINLTGGDVQAQLATSIEHMVTPRATIAGTDGFIESTCRSG